MNTEGWGWGTPFLQRQIKFPDVAFDGTISQCGQLEWSLNYEWKIKLHCI